MSTLRDTAEELEALQHDAAAFRYILTHPQSGVAIVTEARAYYDSSREFESAVREHFRALDTKKSRSPQR